MRRCDAEDTRSRQFCTASASAFAEPSPRDGADRRASARSTTPRVRRSSATRRLPPTCSSSTVPAGADVVQSAEERRGRKYRQLAAGDALVRMTSRSAVRVVGDEAVDAGVDQSRHVRRIVDGPGQHARASAHALRQRAPRVTLRQNGRPHRAAGRAARAAAPSRRTRGRRDPRVHGDGPSASRLHRVVVAVSIVRHTVAIAGARRFCRDERAPVERLQRRCASAMPACANRVDGEPREGRRVDRVLRVRRRIDLGLDD